MAPIYRARAPLRLSFAGGGTDVAPFPSREGGLVLSATINRYAHGTLRPRADGQISIESVDFGLAVNYGVDEPLVYDGELDLVKAAIRTVGTGRDGGFDIFVHSDAPPGSGLGSSSSVMVALIGLLKEHGRIPLTEYEIAHLAYVLEREELEIRGGLQDQYAATFGGFNFIEFDGERVVVNPLRIPWETINELEHNMLLCYTGAPRRSDGIIDDQTARFEAGDAGTLAGLRRQKELAVEMKNALLRGRLNEFGVLLGEAWESKKRLSPRVSTGVIDEAYAAAIAEGALGGKVTGAGGGGHMVFYCRFERKHRVAERLMQLGLSVMEFSFTFRGLDSWTFNDE